MEWPTSSEAEIPGCSTLPELRRTPATTIPGVGTKVAEALRDLGVESVADLISHYPHRHEDLSNVKNVSEVRVGEKVTLSGRVVSTRGIGKPVRGKTPGFSAQLYDGTGYIPVVVWGRNWLMNQLLPDTRVVVSGEVNRRYGIQLAARNVELVDGEGEMEGGRGLEAPLPSPHAGSFVPVYAANSGVGARRVRTLIHRALDGCGRVLDPLPPGVLARLSLPSFHDAVHEVHFPGDRERLECAMHRLVFHELFTLQTALAVRKLHVEEQEKGRGHTGDGSLLNPYLQGLSFELTGAQERAVEEVLAGMRQESPMRRLLQGDVGSGKTLVAVAALLTAVESGGQAALMAPTEVLAEQHYLSISRALADLPVGVVLLTGSMGSTERREASEAVASGEAQIVIGTHTLIQKGVEFDELSLVVVDEQHRFGVSQRSVFKEKGELPDTLVMTATPIPRTLSLTLYGDLEVSVIDELPPGRKTVETVIFTPQERMEAYERVRDELEEGRQAYVICPLVEKSENLEEVQAAEELYEELSEAVFPERNVGLLHGRMKAEEKRRVMAAFREGEIEVLVATVVVEVGVDVTNASAIVIEGAEHFGLSQLHQLRGRVCRGEHLPKCFLVGEPATEDGERRLEALRDHQDGFKLSEVDLAIRGEGTLFGVRQSGMPDLKVAKLLRDVEVLIEARREAFELVRGDPDLKSPEHGPLRQEIRDIFADSVEWLFRE